MATRSTDPAETPGVILATSAMTRPQWIAVGTAILLNALDGYDAASISFAAAGIAEDWGLAPDALGWVLSMELIGMALGSLIFGTVADRFGRRPAILGCVAIMSVGMFGSAWAGDPVVLSIWRVLTGLGIGGMLASLTAIVSEIANDRWRSVVLSTVIVGYPIGTVLGGLVARNLLVVADWRAVFIFGGVISLAMLPLAFFTIAESPVWAGRAAGREGLARANALLARLGHRMAARAVEATDEAPKAALLAIFGPGLARTTILLTLAYVGHMTCYYFIFKWMPKLVVDLGYLPERGADVLIVAMLAGACAGPVFGYAAGRFGLARASMVVLAGAAIAVNVFASVNASMTSLMLSAALVGIFFNSGGVAFYALLADAFPSDVRATGVGFGVGVGRAAAAFGPALGGAMFASGYSLSATAFALSAGPAVALLLILYLFGTSRNRGKAT